LVTWLKTALFRHFSTFSQSNSPTILLQKVEKLTKNFSFLAQAPNPKQALIIYSVSKLALFKLRLCPTGGKEQHCGRKWCCSAIGEQQHQGPSAKAGQTKKAAMVAAFFGENNRWTKC
jgi:hypothetical protein